VKALGGVIKTEMARRGGNQLN